MTPGVNNVVLFPNLIILRRVPTHYDASRSHNLRTWLSYKVDNLYTRERESFTWAVCGLVFFQEEMWKKMCLKEITLYYHSNFNNKHNLRDDHSMITRISNLITEDIWLSTLNFWEKWLWPSLRFGHHLLLMDCLHYRPQSRPLLPKNMWMVVDLSWNHFNLSQGKIVRLRLQEANL